MTLEDYIRDWTRETAVLHATANVSSLGVTLTLNGVMFTVNGEKVETLTELKPPKG